MKKATFILSSLIFGVSYIGISSAHTEPNNEQFSVSPPINAPHNKNDAEAQEPTTLILRNSYGGVVSTATLENMEACITAGGYAVSAAISKHYGVGALTIQEPLPTDMPTEGMCVNMLETKILSAKESEAK